MHAETRLLASFRSERSVLIGGIGRGNWSARSCGKFAFREKARLPAKGTRKERKGGRGECKTKSFLRQCASVESAGFKAKRIAAALDIETY